MPAPRKTAGLTLLTLALLAAGCGNATDTSAPVKLSDQEVAALFHVFDLELRAAGVTLERSPSGLVLSRWPRLELGATRAVDLTVNCLAGGTVTISGTTEISQDLSSVAVNVTQTFHSGCRFPAFDVEGAVALVISGGDSTLHETATGDLVVTPGDNFQATGSCHVDVTLDTTPDTRTPTGTMCLHRVDQIRDF